MVTINANDQPNKTDCPLSRMYFYAPGPKYDYYTDFIICVDPVPADKSVKYETAAPNWKSFRVVKKLPNEITKDEFIYLATGFDVATNVWLKTAQLMAADVKSDCVVCMAARPNLHLVPALPEENATCVIELASNNDESRITDECKPFSKAYQKLDIKTQTPQFSIPKQGNFTCFTRTECPENTKCTHIGEIPNNFCQKTITLGPTEDLITPRQDVWWYCGGNVLRGHCPKHGKGMCAYVALLQPANIIALESAVHHLMRFKRNAAAGYLPVAPDTTYLDGIGVPRGVPEEFKLVDQIATGFENLPLLSAIFPVTPNIKYINFHDETHKHHT